MVIIYFVECAWPCTTEHLEDMTDYDSWMVESGRSVLFPFPSEIIDKVRRVKVRRIVLGIRYSPVRALAAILCLCGINWNRPNVIGWYLYNLSSGDV